MADETRINDRRRELRKLCALYFLHKALGWDTSWRFEGLRKQGLNAHEIELAWSRVDAEINSLLECHHDSDT